MEFYGCDGTCLNDADEDGICDELEVEGCQDETACNYDEFATDAGDCDATEFYDCDGTCLNDVDEDGVATNLKSRDAPTQRLQLQCRRHR